MKNILLATDLSVNADRAMERALKIAKAHKAKLHILHIAPPYPGAHKKQWKHDMEKDLEDLVKAYLYDYKDSQNVETKITIRFNGEIYFEILEVAYRDKADLIIMGMHNKQGLRDLFSGTTIERVIRKGIVPVLMVKNKPLGPYQSIMAAIDFSSPSRAALRNAMALEPKAVFNAIHVYNIPDYYAGDSFVYVHTQEVTEEAQKKSMDAFLKTERSHFKKQHGGEETHLSGTLLEGNTHVQLIEKAKNLKADLITLGTQSRSAWDGLLGSTASDILADPPCDVLVATEDVHELI